MFNPQSSCSPGRCLTTRPLKPALQKIRGITWKLTCLLEESRSFWYQAFRSEWVMVCRMAIWQTYHYLHACIHIHTYIHTYILRERDNFTEVCIHNYTSTHIHIYTHTDRHMYTYIKTDRQAGRQRQRNKHTQKCVIVWALSCVLLTLSHYHLSLCAEVK